MASGLITKPIERIVATRSSNLLPHLVATRSPSKGPTFSNYSTNHRKPPPEILQKLRESRTFWLAIAVIGTLETFVYGSWAWRSLYPRHATKTTDSSEST